MSARKLAPGRTEKTCPFCGLTKPLAEFHANASRADRRNGICAACKRDYARTHVRQKISPAVVARLADGKKRCSRCRLVKRIPDDFCRSRPTADGFHGWCRDCLNSRSRERTAAKAKASLAAQLAGALHRLAAVKAADEARQAAEERAHRAARQRAYLARRRREPLPPLRTRRPSVPVEFASLAPRPAKKCPEAQQARLVLARRGECDQETLTAAIGLCWRGLDADTALAVARRVPEFDADLVATVALWTDDQLRRRVEEAAPATCAS